MLQKLLKCGGTYSVLHQQNALKDHAYAGPYRYASRWSCTPQLLLTLCAQTLLTLCEQALMLENT